MTPPEQPTLEPAGPWRILEGAPGQEIPCRARELEEDRVLLHRIHAGDRRAFRDLVERHQVRVFALVRRFFLGNDRDVEDHAQEIFVRVHRGIGNFESDASLGTWIHRVALNYLIGQRRRARAKKRDTPTYSLDRPRVASDPESGTMEIGETRTNPLACVLDRERGEVIRRAIQALDPELRTIVVLRELEQMSYDEIAARRRIPIGTVRSRLHRARQVLQERLRHLLG